MWRTLPLLLLLAGTPAASEPDTRIFIQITGNVGAAVGQVGTMRITPDGRYRCVVQPPDLLGTGAPPPLIFEGQSPELFATLEVVIRVYARDGYRDPSADIAELERPYGTIAILPDAGSNGLVSPMDDLIVGIVNAVTDPDCLLSG